MVVVREVREMLGHVGGVATGRGPAPEGLAHRPRVVRLIAAAEAHVVHSDFHQLLGHQAYLRARAAETVQVTWKRLLTCVRIKTQIIAIVRVVKSNTNTDSHT